MAHLVERRRDQAGQADNVGILRLGGLQDLRRRHHHAEIDDLVIVALEHDADDVLADIVHVALDGREHDLAITRLAGRRSLLGLLLLHEGHEIGDRLLHHARRLDDLRQEHLAGAEQVADHIHPGHQRSLDDVERARRGRSCELDVLGDIVGDAVHERMRETLVDRPLPPFECGFLRLALCPAIALGEREQTLGRIAALVEHHVLACFAQFRIEIVIDRHLAGIDDAHVHARLDGVIEKHRVHGFAHRLIAAEGEGKVGHAARDMRAGKVRPDPVRRLDEGEAVAIVLLDAGRDREDIRIEDDVLGREAEAADQDVVGALADRGLALDRVGLALLVERHHHHGRAVPPNDLRLAQELRLALLERDRVHHRLALDAFEARLDHAELRGVDHDRHAGDVRLGRDEMEEGRHRRLGIEQALVHVHVDDLRAVLDLLARDRKRGGVIVRLDQLAELGRAGDIGALADIDERDFRRERERLEPGEAQIGLHRGDCARRDARDRVGDRTDMRRRRAAAAADQVDEARFARTRRAARP